VAPASSASPSSRGWALGGMAAGGMTGVDAGMLEILIKDPLHVYFSSDCDEAVKAL